MRGEKKEMMRERGDVFYGFARAKIKKKAKQVAVLLTGWRGTRKLHALSHASSLKLCERKYSSSFPHFLPGNVIEGRTQKNTKKVQAPSNVSNNINGTANTVFTVFHCYTHSAAKNVASFFDRKFD